MAEVVEGIFRKNSTLDSAIQDAMKTEGVGLVDRIRVRWAMNRMSAADRASLEAEVTGMVVEGGYPLPVGASIVGGVLVGDWQSFLQMIIDNLPKILDFISKLLPLFFML